MRRSRSSLKQSAALSARAAVANPAITASAAINLTNRFTRRVPHFPRQRALAAPPSPAGAGPLPPLAAIGQRRVSNKAGSRARKGGLRPGRHPTPQLFEVLG